MKLTDEQIERLQRFLYPYIEHDEVLSSVVKKLSDESMRRNRGCVCCNSRLVDGVCCYCDGKDYSDM
jgi:hypothetical protein